MKLSHCRRRGFVLILVMVVIVICTLAALNFGSSMLVAHEASRISAGRLQSRMCAESGAQAIRMFLAYPRAARVELGGTWSNGMFYARNVIADPEPQARANFTVVAPSLDQAGNYSGIRFGLQNESAKLNLNTLVQIDELASSGDLLAEAAGGLGGDAGAALGLGDAATDLASSSGLDVNLAATMLMALPGMTETVADSILDFIDADDEPRALGAEFDYYQQLPTPYLPVNGPLQSVEQLMLVKGVTATMLYGYDENRNGMLDPAEISKMNAGIQPGMPPGTPAVPLDPNTAPPPPLGWAHYLTLHSQEKNVDSNGEPRININGSDLQTLYTELSEKLGNEAWASFIVAYRVGGQKANPNSNPLATLATMVMAESGGDGAMGTQLAALSSTAAGANQQTDQPAQPWDAGVLSSIDLASTQGGVTFDQVLDLIDATVTIGEGDQAQVFQSPFTSLPLDLASSTPVLLESLTTVDSGTIPGRINIMECPREILLGIPGLTDEVVEGIITARSDGSDSETRNYETWLAVEGYVTMEEMRAILPLVTCGGDVFKAQIVGYLEGDAAFSRIETVIDASGELPVIRFFRRLDHLGRGFAINTLGQRIDINFSSSNLTN